MVVLISMNASTLPDHPWEAILPFCKEKGYKELITRVEEEYANKTIFPPCGKVFTAFELVPFTSIKVVIIGQDPYHDEGQAEGLSFSVPSGTRVPPSLKNIYKEIECDLGIKKDPTNGSLVSWATQGVLLLNSMLTVVAHIPSSHHVIGWDEFTDSVIRKISDEHTHVVFMLWGKYAVSKRELIDEKKHCVLTASHPSPFSCYKGFFGSNHFSKCNDYLKQNGIQEIVW